MTLVAPLYHLNSHCLKPNVLPVNTGNCVVVLSIIIVVLIILALVLLSEFNHYILLIICVYTHCVCGSESKRGRKRVGEKHVSF